MAAGAGPWRRGRGRGRAHGGGGEARPDAGTLAAAGGRAGAAMASQSQGIQQLLQAEKRAAEKVAEARKREYGPARPRRGGLEVAGGLARPRRAALEVVVGPGSVQPGRLGGAGRCRRGAGAQLAGEGPWAAWPRCRRGAVPAGRSAGRDTSPPCSGAVGLAGASGAGGAARGGGERGLGLRLPRPVPCVKASAELGCASAAAGNLRSSSGRGLRRAWRRRGTPGPAGRLSRRRARSDPDLRGSWVFPRGMLVLICIFPTFNFFFS